MFLTLLEALLSAYDRSVVSLTFALVGLAGLQVGVVAFVVSGVNSEVYGKEGYIRLYVARRGTSLEEGLRTRLWAAVDQFKAAGIGFILSAALQVPYLLAPRTDHPVIGTVFAVLGLAAAAAAAGKARQALKVYSAQLKAMRASMDAADRKTVKNAMEQRLLEEQADEARVEGLKAAGLLVERPEK